MDKSIVKLVCKCLVFGVIWSVVLFIIAIVFIKIKDYQLQDVLFVEGIVFIMLGVFSSLGGNPMGLSLQSMGQSNAQYMANANLEVAKRDTYKGNIKTTMSIGTSTVALVFAGMLCIIINFII